MNKDTLLILLVGTSFVTMIAVNGLANILPINGITTGQVSDSYPNLFAPAGVTFSIWGLIYLLLGAYTVYQSGFIKNDFLKKNSKLFRKLNIYFSLSSIANILWIFAWHYKQIGLASLLIVGMLILLIKIANLLKTVKCNLTQQLLIKAPFSIYFGWITVATIAAITTFLVSVSWNGFGISESLWTMAVLIVGAAIGLARMFSDNNKTYGLVFVWAYLGIYIKHTSPANFNGMYPGILLVLMVCLAIFLLAESILLFRKVR